MTDDIVARLREVPNGIGGYFYRMTQQAADEIERLRKERDHARLCACHLFARRATRNRRKRELWYAQNMGWDCFNEATDGNA